MHTPNRSDSFNRKANQAELAHAACALRSFGDSALATFVENSIRLELDDSRPLVVTDFSSVGEEQVLLIPSGTHLVPPGFLEMPRYIIGLPLCRDEYPTLLLEGAPREIIDVDTLNKTRLGVCESVCMVMGVRLDARQQTVLEIAFFSGSQQFSDYLLQVECGENIDVLNIGSNTFRNGRSWALKAYGKGYGSRNALEQKLDCAHEGALKAIDGVFKPLVALGTRLDAMLGSK